MPHFSFLFLFRFLLLLNRHRGAVGYLLFSIVIPSIPFWYVCVCVCLRVCAGGRTILVIAFPSSDLLHSEENWQPTDVYAHSECADDA